MFQARLESLQESRRKLSSRIGLLASTRRIGHREYAKIFGAIQALQHSVALEQKLRHETTMLCCSNFTAFQVCLQMAETDHSCFLNSPKNQDQTNYQKGQ